MLLGLVARVELAEEVREVAQDHVRLRQHDVAVTDRRHLAEAVHGQIFQRLLLALGEVDVAVAEGRAGQGQHEADLARGHGVEMAIEDNPALAAAERRLGGRRAGRGTAGLGAGRWTLGRLLARRPGLRRRPSGLVLRLRLGFRHLGHDALPSPDAVTYR
jgi:hypothetical protein